MRVSFVQLDKMILQFLLKLYEIYVTWKRFHCTIEVEEKRQNSLGAKTLASSVSPPS
jgi:hypothetical protein